MAVKKPKKEFPPLPLEPAFREKVDAAKAAYARMSIADLGRAGEALELRRLALADEAKKINVELSAISELGIDALQSEGVMNYKLESGTLVHQWAHVTVRIENAAAFRAYAEAHGMMDLYQPNTRTLGAIVRARYEAGDGDLPGVAVYKSLSLKYKGVKNLTGGNDGEE